VKLDKIVREYKAENWWSWS